MIERLVTDLPLPELADERQSASGVEVEAHVADRRNPTALSLERNGKIADREHRCGGRFGPIQFHPARAGLHYRRGRHLIARGP